jgi:hypothetical protein
MAGFLRGACGARPRAARKKSASLISQRSPVEVLNRNAIQIDSFEAANIDCGYPIAPRIGAFAVGVNAACPAKAVLDHVLVESVRADVPIRCEHAQLFAGHEPQERSFARAHRAIARHRPVELALYFERNLSAVTATLILHVSSP